MSHLLHGLRQIPLLDLIPLAVVNAYWILGLVYFGIRCLYTGVPRSPRFESLSKSKVIPRWVLEYGYWQLNWQVKLFIRLGFTANMITALSLVLSLVGAVLIGLGHFGLGGWTMFLAFFCDAFDGLVARETGTQSQRGEFFDSVMDRFADSIIGLGFLYYYRHDAVGAAACALLLVGSSAMGYAKAKGALIGVNPNVGIMQRHERAVYLGVSTVLSPFVALWLEAGVAHPRHYLALVALWLVAVFTNVTAVWRTAYVMRRKPAIDPQPAQEAHSAPQAEPAQAAVAVTPLRPVRVNGHQSGAHAIASKSA